MTMMKKKTKMTMAPSGPETFHLEVSLNINHDFKGKGQRSSTATDAEKLLKLYYMPMQEVNVTDYPLSTVQYQDTGYSTVLYCTPHVGRCCLRNVDSMVMRLTDRISVELERIVRIL